MVAGHHYEQRIYMRSEPSKATPSKATTAKIKSAGTKVTSQLIAEHTAAFLKAGGQITKIRSGLRDQEAPAEKK